MIDLNSFVPEETLAQWSLLPSARCTGLVFNQEGI